MATETSTQIVREAPEIEKIRMQLLEAAKAQTEAPLTLPGYQVAGFTDEQIKALQSGVQGIGAYQPFMQQGAQALQSGVGALGESADILRGSDTRGQFAAAQQAMNLAAQPAAALGNLANVAGSGMGMIGTGAQSMDQAQRMAQQYSQANMGQSLGALGQAQQIAQGAGPSDFRVAAGQLGQAGNVAGQATAAAFDAARQPGFQQGIGTLYSAAQQAQQAGQLGLAPQAGAAYVTGPQSFTGQGTAEQFMSPYMRTVVQQQMDEMRRQDQIAQQGRSASAVGAGAFGGSRQAVMEAEAARNLATQQERIMAEGSQQAFGQASQQFNTEQQARMAAQQANQQAAMQAELANQQARAQYGLSGAQMGQQAAQMLGQAGQAQIGASGQQAQLGLSAAAQQFQQAGFDANTAMQLAQLQQTQQTQGLQQSQALQGIGGLYGQQALQQAQLGQGAAGLTGQLGGQQAQLAGQYANIAGQQANILGQQSQLQQGIGQGIGALAGQQFGIGSQMAAGLGSLGTQLGNLGVQQGAMGQTAQQLGQQDTGFLFSLGQQQQRQNQAVLDAERATSMQTSMQPMQNIAFLSDIYKGAPSTQMSMTQQATPAPSPFQQIAGLATGAAATAKAFSI